jgi:hypothetical protein
VTLKEFYTKKLSEAILSRSHRSILHIFLILRELYQNYQIRNNRCAHLQGKKNTTREMVDGWFTESRVEGFRENIPKTLISGTIFVDQQVALQLLKKICFL